MKQLFTHNEKGINGRLLKRLDMLWPSFFEYPSSQRPSRLWQKLHGYYAAFLGEARPRPMLMWLALLVTVLHLALVQKLLNPLATPPPVPPRMMEVALISAPTPETETPSKPVAAPKQNPPPAKLKPLKPTKKMPQPVLRKPLDLPKKTVVAKTAVPAPAPSPAAAEPEAAASHPTTSVAPAASATSVAKTSTSTATVPTNPEAVITRASLGCALKPIFDRLASRQPWKGRLMLRVQVAADGSSAAVQIKRSSGHETLDEAAVDAVKQCSFKPAKRGDSPVSSFVSIPFDYHE